MPAVLSTKWVHQGDPSSCAVAYSKDGGLLYTAGGEDFVRVFSGDPSANNADSLAVLDEELASTVLTLDCSMESLVTGCEDGSVSLFDHSETTYENGTLPYTAPPVLRALVTRADLGLAIRAVKFSPNGTRVAVASDELKVKVVDVRDTTKMQLLDGHTKAVRKVAWSPDGQLISTSCVDGRVRIFDVSQPSELQPNCIQILDGLIGTQEAGESAAQCETVWHPTGRYFVIATSAHEIIVVNKENWDREGEFADKDGHMGEITTLAFSPNGRYLCSTAADGGIIVWDTTTRHPIAREKNEKGVITSLAWRPGSGSNSISYIDSEGYVGRWDNVVSDERAHPTDAPVSKTSSKSNGIKDRSARDDSARPNGKSKFVMDEDDLDLDIGGGKPGRNGMADEGDDDEEEDEDALDRRILAEGDGDIDDFIEDDEDDGAYQSLNSRRTDYDDLLKGLPPALGRGNGKNGKVTVTSGSSSGGSSLIKGQEAFQSGATPSKDKRRYLAFNMLGLIHINDRETHNIVTVEFHDQTNNPSYNFDDHVKYTLGALGTQGAVYGGGRQLAYKPFETWSSQHGEWSLELPVGEDIRCLALGGGRGIEAEEEERDVNGLDEVSGSGTVVVGTSRGWLRFFSASGSQKYLVNLGEEIVTLAASNEWVIVVHRPSDLISPGRQDLSYTVYDLDTYEVLQRGRLPLPKQATLQWIAFSAEQLPYMFDSAGVLSCLERVRRPGQARWVPMLDTLAMERREGKTESYWPVGVQKDKFVCVILKGGEKYPYFPTPITQDLLLSVPVVDNSTPSGLLEASLIQTSLLANHARDSLPSSSSISTSDAVYETKALVTSYDREVDKTLLKLIQLACKADKPGQALDLARMLNSVTALEGARKIADLYHHGGLREKIENLKDAREGDPGRKDRTERMKREGKYAHLVDNTIVPDSGLEIPRAAHHAVNGSRGSSGLDANALSRPFDSASTKKRKAKTASNVFSDAPARMQQQRSSTSFAPVESDEGEEDTHAHLREASEPVYYDDDAEEDDLAGNESMNVDGDRMPAPKRANPFAQQSSVVASPARLPSAAPATKGPTNPFGKRANAPSHPPATNGASQKSTNAGFSGNSLKKTGSFFDRVDAGTSAAASKAKQSTLFGLPAPASNTKPKEASGRGRKRKSETGTNASQTEEESADATTKKPKQLESFFKKGGSSSSTPSGSATVSAASATAAAPLTGETAEGKETDMQEGELNAPLQTQTIDEEAELAQEEYETPDTQPTQIAIAETKTSMQEESAEVETTVQDEPAESETIDADVAEE